MISYIRERHGGCQLRGHLYTPIHPYAPIYPYAPIHLYASYPCVFVCSPYPICSPYVMGTGGICTPYMSWSLWGTSVHLSGILVSVSTSIASTFITAMPVALHYCQLLLYWTGCLWMSAMLHAVVPFFVVFIMSQASTIMAMTTTPLVTVVSSGTLSLHSDYHGPLLDGDSSKIRSA